MKILLINKNPVVSRMINMSASKAGFEVEEISNVNDLEPGEYDVVFLDDEMYDENFLEQIKQNIQYYQIGLMTASKDIENENLDFILPKPFLPTDLLEVLRVVEEKIRFAKSKGDKEEKAEEDLETKGEVQEQEESESIVEIEESEEESPFVEPMDKSGVLDENELAEVTNLLEDENSSNENSSVEQEEQQEHVESSKDMEEAEEIVQVSESEELGNEEENLQLEAKEEVELERDEVVEPIPSESEEIEEVNEEHSDEEPTLMKSEEIEELNEDHSDEELTLMKSEEIEELNEDHSDEEPTQLLPEEDIEEGTEVKKEDLVAPQPSSLSSTELIDKMKQNLTITNLQDLLDGMQIDITIKISYPDRKNV